MEVRSFWWKIPQSFPVESLPWLIYLSPLFFERMRRPSNGGLNAAGLRHVGYDVLLVRSILLAWRCGLRGNWSLESLEAGESTWFLLSTEAMYLRRRYSQEMRADQDQRTGRLI
jgi:hypothetical protein